MKHVFLLAFAALVVTPAVARADRVLVFGSRPVNDVILLSIAPLAAGHLEALGHDVTTLQGFDVLPTTLDYDVVIVTSMPELYDPEPATLRDFVARGGRLYLTAERPAEEFSLGMASEEMHLVRPITGLDIEVGTGVEAAGGDLGIGDEIEDIVDLGFFRSAPEELETWQMVDPGALGEVPSENVLARDEDDNVVAGAWSGEDLGRGCLMVVMDSNWWGADNYFPSGSASPYATAEQVREVATHVMQWFHDCDDPISDEIPDAGPSDAGDDDDDDDDDDDADDDDADDDDADDDDDDDGEDAGADAGDAPGHSSDGGCCGVAGQTGRRAWAYGLVTLAFIAVVRRRRRRDA